jgi:cysteine-rich repeat protein
MSLWNISCSRPGPSAQKLFGHDQWQGLNLGENVSLLQTLDPRTELGTGANMQDPGNTALPPPPNYPLPVLDPFTGGPLLPVPPPPPPPPALLPPLPPAAIGPRCGNHIFLAGKECEDGNQINGDGCSSNCVKEYCGNGLVELYEDCDNGAGRFTVQGPNCDQYCQFIICGDKYVTGDEECDDGNLINCDGCSSCCKVENQCGSAECPCPPTK